LIAQRKEGDTQLYHWQIRKENQQPKTTSRNQQKIATTKGNTNAHGHIRQQKDFCIGRE